mmetsp:Transcript_29977/g.99419  ORF Transcript_29977/g.99419 Transcript_29977/m.99419 type:complete len:177 (-) Transcript_29977:149-679(-)
MYLLAYSGFASGLVVQPAASPCACPAAARQTARRMATPRADAIGDAAYSLSALAVVGLVGRSVFDTVFIENDATVPNKPRVSLPSLFGREEQDPTVEAERIRQRLQAAAEAGDLEAAWRLEKELKQFLWDNNVVYEIDVEPERRGLRIEDMESAAGSGVIQSENQAERDQMLRDLE